MIINLARYIINLFRKICLLWLVKLETLYIADDDYNPQSLNPEPKIRQLAANLTTPMLVYWLLAHSNIR